MERHENKPNVIPQHSFPYAQIWHPPFQIILATIHKAPRPKNTKAIRRPLHPSFTYSPPPTWREPGSIEEQGVDFPYREQRHQQAK
jgi:hypothetical protein